MSEPLLVEQDDDVRWLRLNRPHRRNALDPNLVAALNKAITAAMGDARTAVVVIAGQGPSFCSGADLRQLRRLAERGEDPLPFLTDIADCFTAIEHAPKPVVAAVHGHVVAGGLELALACDVVVARGGTLIGDGHIRNGLLPAGGASARLARKVGEPLARWLLLTGELLPAEAFLTSGFVHAIGAGAQFDAVLAGVIATLRRVSGPTQSVAKQLLTDPALATSLRHERSAFLRNWRDTDVTGALARFADQGARP